MEQSLVIQIHLILENLKGKAYNEDVRKLAEFLQITDIKTLKEFYKGDSNYMACIRKVEELSTDPEFVGYYDIEESHRQDIDDSYNTGYDEGMDDGISQRNIEIAKMMLQDTKDYNLISKYTGLSIEEISKL